MTFSDLQQGLRQYQSGEGDNSLAHGLLIIVASVAVLALVLHLRQRMKTMGPPDSDRKLARELSRAVGFPMFSRLALWWVSRTTGTPMAAMIVCEHLFDVNVAAWAGRPTFSLARGWGKSRLDQLRSKLFAA